jgi:hypothetical protein
MMFYEWTGEISTNYHLERRADGQWELFSTVHRKHTKGVKSFRNSCGLFPDEAQARKAMKKLEDME